MAKRRYGLARLMCRTAATTAAEVYLKVMAVNLAGARLGGQIASATAALTGMVIRLVREVRSIWAQMRYDIAAEVRDIAESHRHEIATT